MSKEITWVDAAVTALERSVDLWVTAPDLVKEIKRTGIREWKSAYPQAVRSLRSALNVQSRKENGIFVRREEECNIYFALRKRLKALNGGKECNTTTKKVHSGKMSVQAKVKTNKTVPSTPPQPLVNGLPSHPLPQLQSHPHSLPHPLPLPLHPIVPTQPYTIEIDPSFKLPQNNCLSNNDHAGNFCLPSPVQSILGPIRTLHIFNGTAPTNHRPVRQARMRKSLKDQENSSPDAMTPNSNSNHDYPPTPPPVAPPPIYEVLRLETCHPVPSLLSEVACVRYTNALSQNTPVCDEDPCKVQGERTCSGRFEIQSLDLPASSESEFDDIDDNDDRTSMDTVDTLSGSENEFDDRILLPTPREKLLVHKPLRRYSSGSSSYSEGLKVDESLLTRETLQADWESTTPAPFLGRQQRMYNTNLGRLQSGNSTSRASLRTTESRRQSSNGLVSSSMLDQRRYVSSLFLPSSPLVGENMKVLLNMDAYRGLSAYQKKRLQLLLPSVDRGSDGDPNNISESSFNNAFYSSALRDWQEHIALGSFTPEYKAKVRGEEKRRTTVKPEDLWKKKFYEDTWGDKRKEGADDDKDCFPVPYYPHNPATPSSGHSKSTVCLKAVMDGYLRKNKEPKESTSLSDTSLPSSTDDSKPPHPYVSSVPIPTPTPTPTVSPPLLPPPPPSAVTAATGKGKLTTASTSNPGALDTPRKVGKAKSTTPSSSPMSGGKNHMINKSSPVQQSPSPRSKNLLPSLLKSKPRVTINKKSALNKKAAVKRLCTTAPKSQGKSQEKSLLHSVRSRSSGQYLTRLPPKLPYHTLLSALEQASKESTSALNVSKIRLYTPPSNQHTHSVFHDHFALLSNEHIPTEFSLPITSLPVRLSREIYHTCLRAKVVQREHSYSKAWSGDSGSPPKSQLQQQQNLQRHQQQQHHKSQQELTFAELKLSVPRSLIRTKEGHGCDGRALVFCSRCHSLYHTVCVGSEGTLCPKCATIVSLLAS